MGDLSGELGVSQPAVSQHLAVLREAELVVVEPLGRRRLYRVDPAAMAELRSYFDGYWSAALDRLEVVAERSGRRAAS